MPFRETRNPYKIWLSEIILQQTRVNQGLPYYYKFLDLFPTVKDLARAKEEDVLKAWQGLGYYSRARNLHFTAKYIANELKGNFPTSYSELIKLKGVGDYTASAISSFSSLEVVPALDGNVYRFISRLYGINTFINTPKALKEFKKVLYTLIDEDRPDLFNQGMIEFGALHCKPTSPDCPDCPFADNCIALQEDRITELPTKMKKKKSIERYLNFYLIHLGEFIYLTRREENAIWKNLYEFPFTESKELFDAELLEDSLREYVELIKVMRPIKHILSHQNIHAKLFVLNLKSNEFFQENWIKIHSRDLSNYPIHRLMEKMIEQTELSQ